jgi:hypothetical protein
VQYVVAPWLILKVIVPWLMALPWRVDGTLTEMLPVSVTAVWPALAMTSNVCVLDVAGPTARVVEALEPWWMESPRYVAVMVKLKPVELVMFVGVNTTSHTADAEPLVVNAHEPGLSVPAPPEALGVTDQATLPPGVTEEPPLVSVIVTSQVVVAPTT